MYRNNLDDCQNIIGDFDQHKDSVSQYWQDNLGQKAVNTMTEISQMMTGCVDMIQAIELNIRNKTDSFLINLNSSSSTEGDEDLIIQMLNDLKKLIAKTFPSPDQDEDSESGNGSHISMGPNTDNPSESDNRTFNLDGSMQKYNPSIFPQEDSEEFSEDHGKVKRR